MDSEQIAIMAIDALNRLGVQYMVVGSLSSNFYGLARSTKDIDIVVIFTPEISAQSIAKQFGPQFRLQPQSSFETVSSTMRFVIDAKEFPFQIELFQLSDDPHDQERFRRRAIQNIYGHSAYLPSAEDVIITKLIWAKSRPHGKDREDIRGIVAVRSSSLEWDYLHRWCDEHGTRELLEEIRRSIPPELS